MPYTINKYNGAQVTVVADGTIDNTLDIKLIGKNYAGYGEVQNENFVFMLENFAGLSQPPKPLTGQLWYDSGNKRIKFFDGTKFRSTGGAETGATTPTGLSTGDMWFDTSRKQLYTWDGSSFVLIGPQSVAGAGITQMISKSVKDSLGAYHPIIQAVVNDQTIFVVSTDSEFVLDNTANSIEGFSTIHQGITLAYSNTLGSTTTSHRFWGTSTDSDMLGGLQANQYITASNASFSARAAFTDAGFTVGEDLLVYNGPTGAIPTFRNQVGTTLQFQTTVSGSTVTPIQIVGNTVVPTVNNSTTIGSSSLKFSTVYATNFVGTATNANNLSVGGTYRVASESATASTVASRNSAGQLYASAFKGGPADTSLAVRIGSTDYSASIPTSVSSVVVRDSSGYVYANSYEGGSAATSRALVLSSVTYSPSLTATASTSVLRDSSAAIYASAFKGGSSDSAIAIKVGSTLYSGSEAATATTVALRNSSSQIYASAFKGGPSDSSLAVRIGSTNYPGNVASAANTVPIRDPNGDIYARYFQGTATSALYADLAEKYLADSDYEVGTVVMIGGEKEVTACRKGSRAIGTVSHQPAFKMNSGLAGGTYIALKGRVPVKVFGPIVKGCRLVAYNDGAAIMATSELHNVFAIALETNADPGVKIVECLVL